MDFVEGLPKSKGYDAIMVVVDRFTKFLHFVPLRHPFTATQVAKVFWDNIVKLHGIPSSIMSDRDKVFTSVLWRELLSGAGTKLLYSTAYHPQTDGQSERVNQFMEMYLRCAVHDTPHQWRRWLPSAEFWYNCSFHSSLGCSPFKALYGVEANAGSMATWPATQAALPDGEQWDWAVHKEQLQAQLAQAQTKYKKFADRNRSERVFQVGEQVLLKLQPYVQKSVASCPCAKLAFIFFGPFSVTARIGPSAYKLDLPPDSHIHPVFHVSQLKPFTPNYTSVFSELPATTDLSAVDSQRVEIRDRRMMKKGDAPVVQIQVEWNTTPPSTTWEDYEVLRRRYPQAVIWNDSNSDEEAHSQGGENVTAAVHTTV
uniref:Integrase catalytic domain-containing protein n=1 Tax=Triticum urartu TaxID=4572 RepID=A0A8R7TPT6_TRIUA